MSITFIIFESKLWTGYKVGLIDNQSIRKQVWDIFDFFNTNNKERDKRVVIDFANTTNLALEIFLLPFRCDFLNENFVVVI